MDVDNNLVAKEDASTVEENSDGGVGIVTKEDAQAGNQLSASSTLPDEFRAHAGRLETHSVSDVGDSGSHSFSEVDSTPSELLARTEAEKHLAPKSGHQLQIALAQLQIALAQQGVFSTETAAKLHEVMQDVRRETAATQDLAAMKHHGARSQLEVMEGARRETAATDDLAATAVESQLELMEHQTSMPQETIVGPITLDYCRMCCTPNPMFNSGCHKSAPPNQGLSNMCHCLESQLSVCRPENHYSYGQYPDHWSGASGKCACADCYKATCGRVHDDGYCR